jgi:hypothetical protein
VKPTVTSLLLKSPDVLATPGGRCDDWPAARGPWISRRVWCFLATGNLTPPGDRAYGIAAGAHGRPLHAVGELTGVRSVAQTYGHVFAGSRQRR